MKRILTALLATALLCWLSACGAASAAQAPAAAGTPSAEPSPTAAPTEAPTAAPTATPTPVPTPEPTPEPVDLNGQLIPADSEALEPEAAIGDPGLLREALVLLPGLKTVTLDREVPEGDFASWAGAWASLEADYPGVAFSFRDLYRGAETKNVTSFAPQTVPDEAELAAVLKTFENLKELDLTALSPAREQVAALAGSVNVIWQDADFGRSESGAAELTLPAGSALASAKAYLACFPRLEKADLLSSGLTEEDGNALGSAFPKVAFRRTVTLNKKTYDSYTEELDLTDARISDYDAFAAAVGRFPYLRSLDLSGCNLSNATLADLRARYPEAGVAWTVRVHGRRVRTDAVAYSSLQLKDNKSRFTSKDCVNFKYCDRLIALDLGHNAISDISWISTLEHLQVLILADNKVKDLTPLRNLKRLKYVELFMNPITDISPLGELTELLDVNLCFCISGNITDLSPLLNCKKLERIWLTGNKNIPEKGLQELRDAFPDAIVSYTNGTGSTGDGWREHPRYRAYIKMFRSNTAVEPFLPED